MTFGDPNKTNAADAKFPITDWLSLCVRGVYFG